ncbi:helix-turn-helix transcriptional regulator [Streptomyces sp. KL118A]|uniref:helix-turn-helix domain-containing protein n=1 Tax=Streptomyces sp. KL118A TaxID=3045153 RepID=UPI00278C598E|nr:transcriptional regulator [Streptomyces sp. KL118A]
MGTGSLAELLRELKERSGLSYGVLSQRLHMSTSAVHRYCSGDAVPPEFATVERFARLCEASPQELVEAHRRWVLADAGRGPRPSSSTASAPGAQEPAGSAPEFGASSEPGRPSRRRRTPVVRVALAVTVAAVTAVGSVALALHDNGDRDHQTQRHIAWPSVPPTRGTPSTSPSDRPGQGSDKNRAHGKNRPDDSDGSDTEAEGSSGDTSPQPSRNGKGGQAPDAPRGGHKKGSAPSGAPAKAPGTPLAARVRPYVYDGCQHSFLVNREPGAMPEPPADQDVPAWVAELGAVSARRQHIEVTLQGAGKGDIVLHAMHVRVRSSGAPPAWNNFRIRTRCEEKVYAKSFDVDLDEAAPRPTPMMGQRDFPYRVSERDPQVLLITAGTKLHNVEWYLELEWSSGKRHGVLRIDDQGRPFRTSGTEGRPTYTWLGSDGWGTERLPLG